MRDKPHKKGAFESSDSAEANAKEFGDAVTGDFLVGRNENMCGIGGFINALNLRDIGKGVKMCYPTKNERQWRMSEKDHGVRRC